MLLMKNKHGEPSVTITILFIGFLICITKLFLSGLIIYGYKFPLFNGSEFAIVMGSLGAIYQSGKYIKGKNKKDNNNEQ